MLQVPRAQPVHHPLPSPLLPSWLRLVGTKYTQALGLVFSDISMLFTSIKMPYAGLFTLLILGLSANGLASSNSNVESLKYDWPPAANLLTQLVIRCPTDRSVCAVSHNGAPVARIAFTDPVQTWSDGQIGMDFAREEANQYFPAYAQTPMSYVVFKTVFDAEKNQMDQNSTFMNLSATYAILDESGQEQFTGTMRYSGIPGGDPKFMVKSSTLSAHQSVDSEAFLETVFPVSTMGYYTSIVTMNEDFSRPIAATVTDRGSADYAVDVRIEYRRTLQERFSPVALSAFAVVAVTP
jgi:hypothetical protein